MEPARDPGQTSVPSGDLSEDIYFERFAQKVQMTDTCWLWTGAKMPSGYGHMQYREKKNVVAHRLAYLFFIGSIPEGLVLDHLCRNRICCNPHHLTSIGMLAHGNVVNAAYKNLIGIIEHIVRKDCATPSSTEQFIENEYSPTLEPTKDHADVRRKGARPRSRRSARATTGRPSPTPRRCYSAAGTTESRAAGGWGSQREAAKERTPDPPCREPCL